MIPALTALACVLLMGRIGRSRPRCGLRDPLGRPTVDDASTPRAGHLRRLLAGRRRRALIAAGAALIAIVVFGPVPTIALGVVLGARPRVRSILAERERRRRIDATFPDAIEMLILVVHAGMTPHQAIGVLADRAPPPVRPAFAAVRHRTSRGAPLADALSALPERLGPGAALVADTLTMSERYGTPIASALTQLSADVRERRIRQREAAARRLPIRMSFPLVACTLPSFVLVAIVPAVLAALSSLTDRGL